MTRTHWIRGNETRWTRDRGELLWRTACGRWLPVKAHRIASEVTCKQCRRYLEALTKQEPT